ncbi:hypothetical protein D9M72_420440 [compost metagenome]
MQAQTESGPMRLERVDQRLAQQFRVPHFHRDDHGAMRGQSLPDSRQHAAQLLEQRCGAAQPPPRQRTQLEHQNAELDAQAFERRPHEFLDGQRRIEENRVDRARPAFFATRLGVGNAGGTFDDETEVVIDLPRISGILACRQRPPERAVHTDRAQKRMLMVGAKTMFGQRARVVFAIPDQPFPARV